jgi:hypothetical protein
MLSFGSSITQMPQSLPQFSASLDDVTNLLVEIEGADISYHAERSKLFAKMIKTVGFYRPSRDIPIDAIQYSTLKSLLIAKDYTSLSDDLKLHFDVVKRQLWEKVFHVQHLIQQGDDRFPEPDLGKETVFRPDVQTVIVLQRKMQAQRLMADQANQLYANWQLALSKARALRDECDALEKQLQSQLTVPPPKIPTAEIPEVSLSPPSRKVDPTKMEQED